MSETATEDEEEPNGEDEKPDLEDDEVAAVDVDDIDPDEIEEEAQDQAVDDDQDDVDASSEDVDVPGQGAGGSDGSWGDMYVTGLCATTQAVKDEVGSGGDVDEQLARQINLDEHFDRFLNEQGVGEDMPPGQAVLVGTCLFLMVEVGTDSEILGKVMEGAQI